MPPARLSGRLAGTAMALALMLWGAGAARADWTTYRGDTVRSGVDSSSVGSLPFAPAWTSPDLGGAIWGQPLVHNGLVVVATESNEVWGLSESTGQKVWQASAGTPVPSSGPGPHPPCGDISPTVGITSTPVIDPATNRVFVVADTLTGSTIQHQLYAFNLSDGSGVPGFPVNAEPPGDVPADQLQRPGLALDNGQVIIGYGGNDGDCGTYHGWLVSIPETGGALRSFEVDRDGTGGAIWGAGNAPPVDSAGDIWVATGNGNTGSTYEFQESVLKLDPSMMNPPLDQWAPSNWQSLDTSDADIGSSAPVLVPAGLVFEIGKQGIGYLLSASSLSAVGARYQASVCSGSWGGGIYFNGIIYVTCSNGLRALSLNAGAATFAPLPGWQVNSTVNGPPTVAGGLVWATDWNNATLYGLKPQTGQTVVKQTTPGMEHFTTPSASDGKLLLATGQTVEAYTIATPASPPVPVPGSSPTPSSPAPATCVLRLRSSRAEIHHPMRRKHSKHAPPAFGTVALIAKCSQGAEVRLVGTVTERLPNKAHHRRARTQTVHLAAVHATLRAGVAKTIQIRLGPLLVAALEHRIRESGAFTLTSGGSAQARALSRLRL